MTNLRIIRGHQERESDSRKQNVANTAFFASCFIQINLRKQNINKLDNYYFPEHSENQLNESLNYYNNKYNHEVLIDMTLEDILGGGEMYILKKTSGIKNFEEKKK